VENERREDGLKHKVQDVRSKGVGGSKMKRGAVYVISGAEKGRDAGGPPMSVSGN